MRPMRVRGGTILALLFSLSVLEVQIAGGWAIGAGGVVFDSSTVRLTGTLVVPGSKTVLVNGSPSPAGTTILTGAVIETGPTGAAIELGALGRIVIAPKSRLTVAFSEGEVIASLISGCVDLHTRQRTSGVVKTPGGVAGTTDAGKDGVVSICFPERKGGRSAGLLVPWVGGAVASVFFTTQSDDRGQDPSTMVPR